MYRARFLTSDPDPRPVKWPVKHPYWFTGESDGYTVVVAYVDSMEQLLEFWPEAERVELGDSVETYLFTSRFQKPEWFEGGA